MDIKMADKIASVVSLLRNDIVAQYLDPASQDSSRFPLSQETFILRGAPQRMKIL
jgi:hypothetical protein